MNKKKVLVIDDEESILLLLEEQLQSVGYDVVTASNGKDGLQYYKQTRFPLVITDIEMPIMDGRELITRIKEIDENAVIIVQTVHSEVDTIIDIMRLGVYDYILKSGNTTDFKLKVERALETAELRKIKNISEKEKIIKLEEQLQWFNWNEHLIKRDLEHFDKALFESLHMGFTQGAGFSTVLTLLKIISMTADKKDDKYMIDSDIFDVINENARIAENAINIFSEVNRIITGEVPMKEVTLNDVYNMLEDIRADIDKFTKIKNQKIIISERKKIFNDLKMDINNEYFIEALTELVKNALKFSSESSEIYIMLSQSDDDFNFSILNSPMKNEKGIAGIPVEYENIVFEPFYRMTKKVFAGYDSLDYGLGLTLVEKIVNRHGGKISLSNIADYTRIDSGPVEKVNAVISLPLKKK